MAAPAGSGAVEAYKSTKVRGANPSVSAEEFVPRASPEVEAKAAALTKEAAASLRAAYSSHDPFRPTGFAATPKELPKGGKKSRRRKRRGGAMVKTVRELVLDLERNPTEATLRNVLSDLKESPNPVLRDTADGQERLLDLPPQADPDPMPVRVRNVIGLLLPVMRGFQYARGGRRRKTTRRRR
jgi:hypothetical protein